MDDPFNIDNLRFKEPVNIESQNKKINLVPCVVREFASKINAIPEENTLTFIIGIGTGGTISMVAKEAGRHLVTELDFLSIMQKLILVLATSSKWKDWMLSQRIVLN